MFDRFLPVSALAAVDAVLLRFAHPICRQTPLMRKGPRNAPRKSDPRPTPPNGVDSKRAGIRSLDCGEEMNAQATTIVRRDPPDSVPPGLESDGGDLGEQRQSV